MAEARQVVMPQESGDESSDAESSGSKVASDWKVPYGPIGIVLGIELCERMSYYTLAGSQKTYLNKQLGFAPASAASMNSVFSMLCYMWCLPGGLMADAIGRYKVIVMFSSIYAVGVVLSAIAVHADAQVQLKGLFLFGTLALIPFGTGGIKPNISNFGADQIGDETEVQKDAQKKFFSFFYMSINVGVMVAFGYLVNVTTHGEPSLGIAIDEGYFAAYLVAAILMIGCLAAFIAATRCYKIVPGGGLDGFLTMVRAVVHSAASGGGWRAHVCIIGWIVMPIFFVVTFAAALQSEPSAGVADAAVANATNATNVTGRLLSDAHVFPNDFEKVCGPSIERKDRRRLEDFATLEWDSADDAWRKEAPAPLAHERRLHGGGGGAGKVGEILTQLALLLGLVSCTCLVLAHTNNRWLTLPKDVSKAPPFSIEDVRAGFATVPIIVVVNICFSMAYNAMNNAFPSQACQMNTQFRGSQLNGAFFNLADALAVVFLTPLFESCLYPAIGWMKGSHVRLGQKLVAGMIIASLSNAVAAWMEIKRRNAPLICEAGFSECAPNGIHMRDMSAFWMFVPFFLMGAAEILVNPCMYYFCYTAAPVKVRSLIQAFNLFFNGSVSNAFTAVAMKATFPNDLDTGHMEYYYFINCTCGLIGVILYFVLTRCGNNAQDIKEKIRDEELDPTEHDYSQHRHEDLLSEDTE